jgi:hypothetical protein
MRHSTLKAKTKLDVFITLHKKDILALPFCVKSISKYLIPNTNKITILSDGIPASLLTEYGLDYIHESAVFDDMTRKKMPKIIYNDEDRTGWYFQQFLKWEARKYSTTNDYVVVDADTIFINPMILIQDGEYVFYRSNKYHLPYLKTYEKLFGYFPEKQMSYIADFMIFNTGIIDEIIARIEKINTTQKWYEIILNAIDKKELSSFSEFETYGYYMNKYYPTLFNSKKYRNKILQKENMPYHTFNKIINKLRGYVSISYHCYDR